MRFTEWLRLPVSGVRCCMNILTVAANARRKAFDVELADRNYSFPFARCNPKPPSKDPVLSVQVDPDLGKRELIRRLGTSATQFHRLLDQSNYSKSIDQLLRLLNVLDLDVDFVIHAKSA